jgi:hypothetical protein
MFWLKNIFDILKRIIPRVKIFLNRPNYSFERNYSYSEDIKKIVTNIEDLISKQLKILKGNYMNFLDSNISFNLRDKYTNIISKIIRNTQALNVLSSDNEFRKILNDVQEKGYANTVSLNIDSSIVKNIHNHLSQLERYPGHIISNSNRPTKHNLKNSKFITYHPKDLLKSNDIQKIIFDKKLISIATEYFDCLPTCITLNCYWQNALNDQDYNPQFFHRDNHDFKLLTYFIFLTDTNTLDGGHEYIKYSNNLKNFNNNLDIQTKNKINSLLKKKFKINNLSKENLLYLFFELDKNGYGHEDIYDELKKYKIELFGNSGSGFLTNNYGVHRAVPPVTKKRLIFWVSFGLFNNQNSNRLPERLEMKSAKDENNNKYFSALKYVYRNYIKFI